MAGQGGVRGQARAGDRELIPLSRSEPGCLFYQANRSIDDPRLFFLYEQYADEAGYRAHGESEHFTRLAHNYAIPELLEDRQREFFEPSTTTAGGSPLEPPGEIGARVLGRTRVTAPPRPLLLAAAIVVVAINLRASITAVGPIIDDIRADLGLSSAAAGLLTTLPVLAFAGASPVAVPLSRRIGIERTLAGALALLLGGILLRVTGPTWAAFTGTALLGVAIAAGNVLLPALVKRDLPTRIGPVTSLYVTLMVAFAGIASTISVPLADDAGFGWRGALAVWAVPAAVGLVVWLPRAARSRPPALGAGEGRLRPTRMRRSAIAWWVTAYMGLQSFAFYVLVAWFPDLLQDDGVPAATAGALMGIMQAASLLATIAVPVLATRSASQRRLVSRARRWGSSPPRTGRRPRRPRAAVDACGRHRRRFDA